jgi:YbbR domain-containing protein
VNFRRNLSLKLVAVFLAFAAWFWVESQGDLLKTVQVPVDLTGLSADLELVGDTPDDVSVRLRGPEVSIRSLSPERLRLVVNLAGESLQPGRNDIQLTARQVRVPAGVTVDRITPGSIQLAVERMATREVPVQPTIQGLPAPGFEVAGMAVRPERVIIEGPEPAVKDVESVGTPSISIDGAKTNQRMEVVPLVAGQAGSQVRLANPTAKVEVLVRVRPLQDERILARVTIVAAGERSAGPTPRFRPAATDVRVTGPRESLEALTAGDLQVVADLTGLAASATDLPSSRLQVRPVDAGSTPEGLEFFLVSTDAIHLTWEKGR